jgi:hypothetical protein
LWRAPRATASFRSALRGHSGCPLGAQTRVNSRRKPGNRTRTRTHENPCVCSGYPRLSGTIRTSEANSTQCDFTGLERQLGGAVGPKTRGRAAAGRSAAGPARLSAAATDSRRKQGETSDGTRTRHLGRVAAYSAPRLSADCCNSRGGSNPRRVTAALEGDPSAKVAASPSVESGADVSRGGGAIGSTGWGRSWSKTPS